MKRFPSIKKNSDFQKVYEHHKFQKNALMVLYTLPNETGAQRIGICVSKKIGNSVVRHHVTRLLREIFRLNQSRIKTGYDLVLVARPVSRNKEYKELSEAFLQLVKKSGLLTSESGS